MSTIVRITQGDNIIEIKEDNGPAIITLAHNDEDLKGFATSGMNFYKLIETKINHMDEVAQQELLKEQEKPRKKD